LFVVFAAKQWEWKQARVVADMSAQIAAYDPRWPRLFATQREHLAGILRVWLSRPVEHVGSTAVPGLASKAIIDILAPVTSLADVRGAVPLLVDVGWLYWADDPNQSWRIWFLRPRIDARTHHLYLIEPGAHTCSLRSKRRHRNMVRFLILIGVMRDGGGVPTSRPDYHRAVTLAPIWSAIFNAESAGFALHVLMSIMTLFLGASARPQPQPGAPAFC
jgi:GrpB-like predicted nucleotidyltransferase (UPF0157 family)